MSALLLSISLFGNALVALAFLFRKAAHKRSDLFSSVFHAAFALNSIHLLFIVNGQYAQQPELLFLPVYCTLLLGPALFFFVKLRLFPQYRFEGTDIKHFMLPAGQVLYFLIIFLFTSQEFRQGLGRRFWSPFYGGLEMGLFIFSFNFYMVAAYRYLRFRIARLQQSKGSTALFEALHIRRMIRVLFILFLLNSVYILMDFVMYELLRLNMHDFRGFTRSGEIAFAMMALWVMFSGISILLRHPYYSSSERLWQWFRQILSRRKKVASISNEDQSTQ